MFAKGVDLGWVSQLREMGVRWYDDAGSERDIYKLCRKKGADSVRYRIFVNPPRIGYWQKRDGSVCMLGRCDAASVLSEAKRAKEAGMRIMLDFHYSDHFADPEYQEIPSDWLLDDEEGLCGRIREHTASVLKMFLAEGIVPEWVQVGNEINPGLLLPKGSLEKEPAALVRFLNAGYETVKEVSSDTKVVLHLAAGQIREECAPFLENFFERGGKTDILGFSYYPYWSGKQYGEELLRSALSFYRAKWQKPVMLCEIGGVSKDPEGTKELIAYSMRVLKEVNADLQGAPTEAAEDQPAAGGECAARNLTAAGDTECSGIFYWEPAVCEELLPDAYPLCASELLQKDPPVLHLTSALGAFRE